MMKKYIAFIVAAVMLMLAACNPSQQGQQGQPETQPTTTAPTQTTAAPTETTKPTETTVSTETKVPPTTVPPTTESVRDPSVPGSFGSPFVYDGSDPTYGDNPDLSECVLGYLYYVDFDTGSVFFVTDGTATVYNSSDTHIFYVKEAEPNKIYMVPLADLTQHTVVYESDTGEISSISCGSRQYRNTALQILVANRQFVWLDLTTGDSEIYMEQYYIATACVETGYGNSEVIDGEKFLTSSNQIWFVGQLSENDEVGQYWYFRDTGEITICTEN